MAGRLVIGNVGRADQREIALVRNDKDDPVVRILQHVGMLAVVELADDDVAAFDEPHMLLRRTAERALSNISLTHGPPALIKARAR